MSERTDAEWQVLADRIARVVMGWEAKPYGGGLIYPVPEQVNMMRLIRVKDWQPHNDVDVGQALAVLDRIAETYHYGHSIFLLASHLTHYRVLIWKGFGCVGMWQGEHTSRAKAICLAIEKFMEESC